MQDFQAIYQQFFPDNYGTPQALPVDGSNATLRLEDGSELIDFTSGIAVVNLGHGNDELKQVLHAQVDKLWHTSNFTTNKHALTLAEKLCELTFADKVFFCNSGSEAVEASVKFARRYATDNFGLDKSKVLCFTGAFHGRSIFNLALGSNDNHRKGFGPFPSGIERAKFNDIESVEAVLSHEFAAVIIEPIQGESGVHPTDRHFIERLRQLCDQYQVTLIFDEVQTGIGRTGHFFAYQGLDVTPDVVASAKALANGLPIGAVLMRDEIANSLTAGSHGSTFGGNHLAMTVASKVCDIVADDQFLLEVQHKSELLTSRLHSMNHNAGLFSDIRSSGLLVCVDLVPHLQEHRAKIIADLWQSGLAVLPGGTTGLRLIPPLTITDDELTRGLNILSETLGSS